MSRTVYFNDRDAYGRRKEMGYDPRTTDFMGAGMKRGVMQVGQNIDGRKIKRASRLGKAKLGFAERSNRARRIASQKAGEVRQKAGNWGEDFMGRKSAAARRRATNEASEARRMGEAGNAGAGVMTRQSYRSAETAGDLTKRTNRARGQAAIAGGGALAIGGGAYAANREKKRRDMGYDPRTTDFLAGGMRRTGARFVDDVWGGSRRSLRKKANAATDDHARQVGNLRNAQAQRETMKPRHRDAYNREIGNRMRGVDDAARRGQRLSGRADDAAQRSNRARMIAGGGALAIGGGAYAANEHRKRQKQFAAEQAFLVNLDDDLDEVIDFFAADGHVEFASSGGFIKGMGDAFTGAGIRRERRTQRKLSDAAMRMGGVKPPNTPFPSLDYMKAKTRAEKLGRDVDDYVAKGGGFREMERKALESQKRGKKEWAKTAAAYGTVGAAGAGGAYAANEHRKRKQSFSDDSATTELNRPRNPQGQFEDGNSAAPSPDSMHSAYRNSTPPLRDPTKGKGRLDPSRIPLG